MNGPTVIALAISIAVFVGYWVYRADLYLDTRSHPAASDPSAAHPGAAAVTSTTDPRPLADVIPLHAASRHQDAA